MAQLFTLWPSYLPYDPSSPIVLMVIVLLLHRYKYPIILSIMSSGGHFDNPQKAFEPKQQDIDEQSMFASKVSAQTQNNQTFISYFTHYKPTGTVIDMAELHGSPRLKLRKYKDSSYYGEFINSSRHGAGIMIYNNARVYEGHWKNNTKYGRGYEKFPNGSIYEGLYVNGKPEGIGKYSWPNGQFYQGEWLNGLKHGSGFWSGAKGDSYLGEWKFGKAEGHGVHTWINGDRYEGDFKNCLKDGEGVQKFANGDFYKGKYYKGKPNGYGEYYWNNGSYFKGHFQEGLRHGQGLWKKGLSSADKYEGEYFNDKKNGYGIFTWSTGNVYKGNYELDLRSGTGEMYWNDGSFYKGNWAKGIQHGQGEIYVPGEGYKRGIFEDNVLVEVFEDKLAVESRKKTSYATDHGSRAVPSSKNEGSRVVPTSKNERSRIYSSKRSRKCTIRSEEDTVSHHESRAEPKVQPAHRTVKPLLPSHFNRAKQNVVEDKPSLSIDGGPKKERVLHSAFYLHKLHRASTAKSQPRTKPSLSNEAMDELKSFTRNKMVTKQERM